MRTLDQRANAANRIAKSQVWPLVVAEINDIIAESSGATSVEAAALKHAAEDALRHLIWQIEVGHKALSPDLTTTLEDFK